MQVCNYAHNSSLKLLSTVAPLHSRFRPSGLHSPNGDRQGSIFPSRAAAQRATPHFEKVANRQGVVQHVPSPPQAPLTLSRPAVGAAHGVDDA